MSDEHDPAIIPAFRHGDVQAFERITRRYARELQLHCYRMTGSLDDAEDLLQETLMRAWNKRDSFEGRAGIRSWLYRIAINQTINFLKQRKKRTQMSLNELDFNAEHDPDVVALISEKTPRRELGLTELQMKLNEAMQKLSETHRLVVTLHDIQGLSHEEIGRIMDCNTGTVRSRLARARSLASPSSAMTPNGNI